MRIQHNIMAMNAYRNYNTNTSALSKNLEKLSSGYKINRAGDDAAGLAISEKMRAQITGLEGAQKNAKDGISLVQTAEGALTEVHDMLNRMYSLAEQSANGTYQDDVDREQLQKEVDQLRTEINRISESANFNGIKLLDGSLDGEYKAAGTEAINQTNPTVQDGKRPTAATNATVSFSVVSGATVTINNQALTVGTTTAGAFASMTVGTSGLAIGDLFTIKVNGTEVTAGSSDAISAGSTITLEAKNAGALETKVLSDLEGIKGASGLNVVNGTNVGSGSAAQKAKYDITFDLTKLSGGDTFQLGGKTFKISTDGVTTTGNGVDAVIDLSKYAISGSSVTAQTSAANAIMDALSTAFGSDYTFTAPTSADLTSGKFTLSFEAITAGGGVDLGEVKLGVNNANTDAISYTHRVGAEEGIGEAGSYASVSYDIDLTKLAQGDKITIGNTTVTIVGDDEADGPGFIKFTDAKDATKLVDAFQQAGFNSGKITIENGKLTITDNVKGTSGDNFKNGNGKLTFVPKNAPEGASASGGLTLQIGENSETYNQLTVQIKATDAKSIGIGAVDIGTQAGAASALADIENAINYISDVRGTLGATQNRLDHTINNLSVMQENIQDAESTIRDTDVADEMMAYTKNNILIQSAQAMLAQANQVPQGVLQLLG